MLLSGVMIFFNIRDGEMKWASVAHLTGNPGERESERERERERERC